MTLCTCETCGHRFDRCQSQVKRHTYCSPECYAAARTPRFTAAEMVERIRISKRESARRRRAANLPVVNPTAQEAPCPIQHPPQP
jgi:hypothetical protein